MTIQQLKCFVAMAEEMHYTKAAGRLYISQPSLSYSIAELEKELDLPLFERRDNHTVMTDYGQALLPYAREILDKVEGLRAKADALADPSVGTVNLGNIYSISFDFVPKVLEGFYADRDNGRITVGVFQGVNQVLTGQLLDGSLDLMLAGRAEEKYITGAYVFTQELKLVVPRDHPLAARRRVRLEDLRGERLVSLGQGSNIRSHLTQCFQSRGVEPHFALEVAECSAMGAFISSGMGVAVAPIVPSLKSNSVRILPFVEQDRRLLGRRIYLQWVKDRYLPPAARRLQRFILNQFAQPEQAE